MYEKWKNIPNFKDYQVSNLGRVKSNKFNKERILKYRDSFGGYYKVALYDNNKKRKEYRIHRLVLEIFKPNENYNNLEVNHIDGNKINNRLDNLEWCTHKENIEHAFKIGLQKNPSGVNHPRSKLNNKMINIIKLAYNQKYFNINELSHIFKVHKQTISRLLNDKTYKEYKSEL